MISQTKGYRIIASRANGQQRTSKMQKRSNLDMAYVSSHDSLAKGYA
jgi:hypothetical protein